MLAGEPLPRRAAAPSRGRPPPPLPLLPSGRQAGCLPLWLPPLSSLLSLPLPLALRGLSALPLSLSLPPLPLPLPLSPPPPPSPPPPLLSPPPLSLADPPAPSRPRGDPGSAGCCGSMAPCCCAAKGLGREPHSPKPPKEPRGEGSPPAAGPGGRSGVCDADARRLLCCVGVGSSGALGGARAPPLQSARASSSWSGAAPS
jgi:hypothetical protein